MNTNHLPRVLVACAGVGLLLAGAGCTPTPAPTTRPATTIQASTAPTSTDSPTSPTAPPTSAAPDPWAGFPPKNLDNLKDLSSVTFPDKFQGYTLDEFSPHEILSFADYSAGSSSISVRHNISLAAYALSVKSMTDPQYVASAVCSEYDVAGDYLCVMAGRGAILQGAVNFKTEADKAKFAQWFSDLYEAL